MRNKLFVGFITYNDVTAKYLPYFLDSLKKQTFKDYKIIAFDNSEKRDNDNTEFLKHKYPEIETINFDKNVGFAKAYNYLINQAISENSQYFLVINPDVILEENCLEILIKNLDNDGRLGSVSPKILKWNFKNNIKTKIIDSCGIELKPGLRFIDLGQGKIDKRQFDNYNILGPSGACGLFRISSLETAAVIRENKKEYFDELMFMYKEDCDLNYRLFLSGFESKLASQAIAYHDRSASALGEGNLNVLKNRKNKNKQIKEWSFLNQQIIFLKYWKLQDWQNKILIIGYEIKAIIYILISERYLLKQFWNLLKIKNKISKL